MIDAFPVLFWPGILIALALLVAFSWVLVRHAGLAAVMALSPMPGFVLTALGTGRPPTPFAYVPGFIAAGFLAGAVAPLVANIAVRQAVRNSLRDLWLVFLAAVVLFAPAAFTGPAALCCMAGEISAVALTALAAIFLSYDEEFVVQINRAGEARTQEFERLDFLTKPRWSMSIAGVALVFSALGFFGAQKEFAAVGAHPLLFAVWALVFLLCVLAVTRNVRRALAVFLAMVPVVLLLTALSGRLALPAVALLLPLTAAAMPVLFMAAGALGFESSGDRAEIATRRGIERFGPTIAITVIVGAAATILCELQAGIVESAALLLGGIAALCLQPALTTMLYSLFPKRVSLEEAFRKR
jgi:hypothetical protein